MKSIFEGIGVALVTPFYNNKVDYDSLKILINKTIAGGADAIILLGTTGEAPNITQAERKNLIKFCKKLTENRVCFIVGTGSNNMQICKQNTKLAKELGADGILAVTPYYNKTTQKGIIEYYRTLAEYKIPIIMYNVPSRTGLNIELNTIKEIISSNPYIFGLKESSSDINRITELSKICKDRIALYSGEDNLNYIFYTLNAQGCISVTANAYPEKVSLIYKLIKKLEYKKALELQQELDPLNKALFCETNPIPIKHILNKMNIIKSNEVRPPLVQLSTENKTYLDNIITKTENPLI